MPVQVLNRLDRGETSFRKKPGNPRCLIKSVLHQQPARREKIAVSTSDNLPYGIKPIRINPKEDKVTRMSTQSARIEAGYVLLPERATWLQDFQSEITQFPNGVHDDQVDSLSQFLWWVERRKRRVAQWVRVKGL